MQPWRSDNKVTDSSGHQGWSSTIPPLIRRGLCAASSPYVPEALHPRFTLHFPPVIVAGVGSTKVRSRENHRPGCATFPALQMQSSVKG
jgi:hypothetical protein